MGAGTIGPEARPGVMLPNAMRSLVALLAANGAGTTHRWGPVGTSSDATKDEDEVGRCAALEADPPGGHRDAAVTVASAPQRAPQSTARLPLPGARLRNSGYDLERGSGIARKSLATYLPEAV